MRLVFESDLDGPSNRRVITIDASESRSFVHAALEEHRRFANPLASDHVVNSTSHEPYHYEVAYSATRSNEWIPPSIRIDPQVTVGTVAAFFGDEITSDSPTLRLEARGPRGDSGFYPAEVALDVLRGAFEVYGYVVAGAELVRFAARRRTGVPFRAVAQWKETGRLNDALKTFVQRQIEWTPTELANLIDSTPAECRSLLTECGFRMITDSGLWWRETDRLGPAD